MGLLAFVLFVGPWLGLAAWAFMDAKKSLPL